MEYMEYLETLWFYLPYMLYTFVILTLLPKSLGKIKAFADADYEANRNKYHRCYGPDICCHTLAGQATPKPKQRKAVTRVYPKRQLSTEHQDTGPKRLIPTGTSVLSANHVNEIAKMFESGGASQNRKINRVPPTILPEIRMNETSAFETSSGTSSHHHSYNYNDIKKYMGAQEQQQLENIENMPHLMNQLPHEEERDTTTTTQNWRSEPIPMPRRQRPAPTTLSLFSDGASATSSTGSPTASSDSTTATSLDLSPTLRRVPLNLKSSLEDIFAAIARNAENNGSGDLKFAGCNSLSPVTSIDDILSQRRLSRPLSAYSISDLLNEENNSSQQQQQQHGLDDALVASFLRTLNKA